MSLLIDKVALICLRDNKILSTRSKNIDCWYLPGGKREAGESDFECLDREIREELTVNLIYDSLSFYRIFTAQAFGHPIGTLVKMTCYKADFTGLLKAGNEIESFGWLGYDDRLSCSEVDQQIFDALKHEDLLA